MSAVQQAPKQTARRFSAVQAVADVGLSSPAAARALGEETVRVLCERIRDRELRVRLHAVVAVGRIYQAEHRYFGVPA